jgi:hypothetical protein
VSAILDVSVILDVVGGVIGVIGGVIGGMVGGMVGGSSERHPSRRLEDVLG